MSLSSLNSGYSPLGLEILNRDDYVSDSEDHSYQDNSSNGIDVEESEGSCEIVEDGLFPCDSPKERDDPSGIESMLSRMDLLFLVGIRTILEERLNVDEYTSITSSEVLQENFNEYLRKKCKIDNPSGHSVEAIVASIWFKSRECFTSWAVDIGNNSLDSELQNQIIAGEITCKNFEEGIDTRVFTQQQVKLLHIIAVRNAFGKVFQRLINIDAGS